MLCKFYGKLSPPPPILRYMLRLLLYMCLLAPQINFAINVLDPYLVNESPACIVSCTWVGKVAMKGIVAVK